MPPSEFLVIQPWPGQFRRRYRCTFGAGYSAWMIFFRTRLRKHVGRSVRRYRSLPQRQRHRLAPPPSVRVAHDLVQFVITHFRKMLNSFRELGEMRSRRINRPPPIHVRAGAGPMPQRVNADPENLEKGLAQLVLTVVELLRQLMERQ